MRKFKAKNSEKINNVNKKSLGIVKNCENPDTRK